MKKVAQKGDFLDILLRSKKTVFSVKDVVLLWGDSNIGAVQVRLNYYVKNKKLIHLRRGIYAKDSNYNKYELANHIVRPSYVSFETVLAAAGINFQYSSHIFSASYAKREIVCDGAIYEFFRIKKSVLTNPAGIDQNREHSIAVPERAFLDTIYRSKDYHFDNLGVINWDKVFEILPIYENKKMNRKVEQYHKWFQSGQL
jgi:hypothetical protein